MGEHKARHEYKHSTAHVLTEGEGPASSRHIIHDPVLAILGQQYNILLIFVLLIGTGISLYLHDQKSAMVMVIVALLNSLIGLRHMGRPSDWQESSQLNRPLIQISVTLAAVLVSIAFLAKFDLDTTLLYALAITVAILPNGLITSANVLLARAADRLTENSTLLAIRCAFTDNVAQLTVVLISLIAQATGHIPLALIAVQILAIDIFLQMLPLAMLKWEKHHKFKGHVFTRHSIIETISFGMFTATLAYLNFLFFFERRDLSPVRIDTHSQLYAQAATLTMLSIILCQFVNLMLVRSDEHEKVFTSYLWSNKKLLVAFGISFFLLGNIIYNPWVSPYFHAAALSFGDVVTALAVAFIYCLLRLSQRHTRKHTRSELFRDHDHETLSSHPKLA